MKLLIILTPLLFTLTVKSQLSCDKKIDTIPLFFHVADTSHYYDYFNSNGTLAWGKVKGWDISLLPVGGHAVQGKNVNPHYAIISGWGLVQNNDECRMVILKRWDLKYKELDKKYWINQEIIPR